VFDSLARRQIRERNNENAADRFGACRFYHAGLGEASHCATWMQRTLHSLSLLVVRA